MRIYIKMCGTEYVLKQFTLDFQVGPVCQNCLYLSRASLSVQVLDFPATLVFIFAVLKSIAGARLSIVSFPKSLYLFILGFCVTAQITGIITSILIYIHFIAVVNTQLVF